MPEWDFSVVIENPLLLAGPILGNLRPESPAIKIPSKTIKNLWLDKVGFVWQSAFVLAVAENAEIMRP